MAPQSRRSPNLGDFGTPIWESQDKKNHLDVGPMERCKVYYKGEGGGFPKSRPWWVLCVRVAYGLS